MKNVLEGIGGCAAFLCFLALVWAAVQAGWEKFWYGHSVSFAETAARAQVDFGSAQTAIPALLWVVVVYLGGGAVLYLVIAVFLWARKQWEPEVPTIAEQDGGLPETVEEREDLLDEATGHMHDGRPICQRCGEPIAAGNAVLLTDDEKNALVQGRGVKSLPGAFRHRNEADCGKPNSEHGPTVAFVVVAVALFVVVSVALLVVGVAAFTVFAVAKFTMLAVANCSIGRAASWGTPG